LDAERRQKVTAYFALMEAGALLRHHVEQQLRRDGDLSYVQFRILAQLANAPEGTLRMTDIADGVVYSRSGLTYQAGLLAQSGLVRRETSPDDERAVAVTITQAGKERLDSILPGHVATVNRDLFGPLSEDDVRAMADVLSRVRDHLRTIPPRSAAPRPGAKKVERAS